MSNIEIDPLIFHKNPSVAYAFLGFLDGKLGKKCDPPKGQNRAEYMREYAIGTARNLTERK